METLYYDIKGKFDENERQRKLFSIAICSDKIINFTSNTACDLEDLKDILNYIDDSMFFFLMSKRHERKEEPLSDFHIGGNFRLVLNKNKSKKVK